MNKDNEAWYWNNLSVVTALILLIAMIALCSLLAPDRKGKERPRYTKMTIYQFNAWRKKPEHVKG